MAGGKDLLELRAWDGIVIGVVSKAVSAIAVVYLAWPALRRPVLEVAVVPEFSIWRSVTAVVGLIIIGAVFGALWSIVAPLLYGPTFVRAMAFALGCWTLFGLVLPLSAGPLLKMSAMAFIVAAFRQWMLFGFTVGILTSVLMPMKESRRYPPPGRFGRSEPPGRLDRPGG